MKFVVLTLLFVTATLVSSQCPLSLPYQCPDSNCVASVSDCPANLCSGTTPYLCSDGTCAQDSQHCNCIGVLCVDGSCKPQIQDCPILASCPQDRPQRCPNGQCFPFDYDCSLQPVPTCDNGLVLCIDGLCRTAQQCANLPYNGCPIFQCPDGRCTSDWNDCLCNVTYQRCWDNSCVPAGSICPVQAPATTNPMNVSTTVGRTSSSDTSIPSSTNSSTTVASVRVPANTTTNSTDVLRARAVPGSTLSNTTTTDSAGNVLPPRIISTALNLTLASGQNIFNNSISINFTSSVGNATITNPCCATLVGSEWVCMNTSTSASVINGTLSANCTTNHFSSFAILDAPQYICNPKCPEDQCDFETYDLVSSDNVVVGWVDVGNILAHEIHFELHTFEDRTNSNFGWQLNSLYLQVGQVTYKDSFSERYREFVKIDMEKAFPPLRTIQCWDHINWFLAASVFDDGPCSKRNDDCPRTYHNVYAVPRNKRTEASKVIPESEESISNSKRNNGPFPDVSNPIFYSHTMCCECDFRAEKQADYGRECNGNANPLGCYLSSKFSYCFTSGLRVGCSAGNNIFFDSVSALQAYLDRANQPAAKLTQDHWNPASTESGKLGGLVVSLVLNDRLDRCDIDFAGSCDWLQSLYICPPESPSDNVCSMFFGQRILDILVKVNNYLGGCEAPPVSVTLDDVAKCIDYIQIHLSGGRRPSEFLHDGIQKTPC